MPVSSHSVGPARQPVVAASAATLTPAKTEVSESGRVEFSASPRDHAWSDSDTRRSRQHGFTLIELVVVLLVAGVLLVVGMPRFFDQLTFQEWGFSDELGGALRFAQKLAVASGCDTQVAIGAGGYQLNQRASCDSGAFTTPVRLPGGDSGGYAGTPPGGIALTPLSLYFDSQGRPRASAGGALLGNTTVTVGSRSITVETQTGYVH